MAVNYKNIKDVQDELTNYKFALNQHSIVAVTDKLGRITFVNDKFCELSQYSSDELIGQDHRIINSGHHSKEFFKELYNTIHAGKVWKGKIKNKAKDGSYYWVATTITPIKNDKGDINEFIAIHTDITESKRVEENLIKNNNELKRVQKRLETVIEEYETIAQQLQDASNSLIATNAELKQREDNYKREKLLLEESQSIGKLGGWELDLSTGNLFWTAETYRIHETSPDEFNPTVDAGVGYFLSESKKIISDALEAAMTKGEGYDLDLETYTTKGSLIQVRTTCRVTMEDGKPVKLTGIFQDITEQKTIQNELVATNTRLSLATVSAKIGIWEFIFEDNTLIWNDIMFDIFDVDKNEFSGTYEAWRATVHPDDLAQSESILENAIAKSESFNNEFRVVWKDKSIHHIKAMADVVKDVNGKPYKMIGVNYDITEQIQREIDLSIAKDKAEENDRLKSAFLVNMRHEIRTPMNAIIGFSKEFTLPNITESQRAEYSSIVINSTNQLLSIIDDITSISLLETKQEHINKSDVNINDLLTELKTQFSPEAKTRNLNLVLSKYLQDEQATIATDKSKLIRIISNLLTNALKFTHNGTVSFGYKVKDGELLFFVKDTGIGIDPKHHEKIFGSFQQADGSIVRKYGGTGLGLSISKGLTEILGGKIWIESELNKGSIFYVSMPFDSLNLSKDISDATVSIEQKTSVLIAEDQFINFQYLKILFERNFRCDIFHAKNGEEAVELIKKNPNIALVLMDISMPVMDGFDASILIKQIKPDVPIIAQTGYDIESNKKFQPTMFNDFVSKPIDENKLMTKVALIFKPNG